MPSVHPAVAVLLLTVAAPSLAAKKSPADTQAKAAFDKAQKEYDLGEFTAALAGYGEAYRLKPLPAFLFNIAQCHRQMGNYERAAFFYRRYLDTSPQRPANADTVEGLIVEMQTKNEAKERLARADTERQKELEPAKGAPPKAPVEAETELKRIGEAEKAVADAPKNAQLQPSQLGASPPLVTSGPRPEEKKSIFTTWWFWTGVGVVAAGTVAAVATRPPPASLGDLNVRRAAR
ncbi:MAG: tetratricopeptide repeat protein [Myxococcota bacterium]